MEKYGYIRMLDPGAYGIAPVEHWERYGKLQSTGDRYIREKLRAVGFHELRENVYEYNGSPSKDPEEILRREGFVRLRHDD